MAKASVVTEVVDVARRDGAAQWLRQAGVRLPTFAELADPVSMRPSQIAALGSVDPDRADPANLFRVHWYNDRSRAGVTMIPAHLVLRPELTGVPSPIIVALGCFFPMIAAHKVLAAYGCLVPYLVTGRFDPDRQKLVWPSTGNYCRGGVAISRILGCRGIAVLPSGMSQERFEWLRAWVVQPQDIIRTPGSESNVREIYDRCAELALQPDNVVLNQFAEFGNYVAHYTCTGAALARLFESFEAQHSGCRLAAFVAASGSAGTLAAGDFLKQKLGARIVVAEASECPTLLRNGFGEHNIQGIGDKHVPYIHNVMNTDLVVGVSDRSVAALDLLFASPAGRAYLTDRRQIVPETIDELNYLGLSGIANLIAAIKAAKRLELGEEDVLITVATDSAALYVSERRRFLAANYPDGFDPVNAGEVFGQHLLGAADNDVLELTHSERSRIFNLGYFTWVEQQGVRAEDFESRRSQSFWRGLRHAAAAWDERIAEFNARAGFGEAC